MRRLAVILLAGIVSAGLGVLLIRAATDWAPCQGEQLSCTMNGVVGLIAVLALAGAATVVFGAVMFWKPTRRAVTIAFAMLLVPVALLLYEELRSILILRQGWSFYWKEYQGLLQIVAAPALVVVAQWAFFMHFVTRSERAPAKI